MKFGETFEEESVPEWSPRTFVLSISPALRVYQAGKQGRRGYTRFVELQMLIDDAAQKTSTTQR